MYSIHARFSFSVYNRERLIYSPICDNLKIDTRNTPAILSKANTNAAFTSNESGIDFFNITDAVLVVYVCMSFG